MLSDGIHNINLALYKECAYIYIHKHILYEFRSVYTINIVGGKSFTER